MEPASETIFDAFKRNVDETLVPYLDDFHFLTEDYIQEGPQWINARFVRGETALVVSISMYEDDASKGMTVTLHTPDGDMHLSDEVGKQLTGEFPVYLFSTDVIDAEFKRIVRDIEQYFEPLLEEPAPETETKQQDTSPGITKPNEAYEEKVPVQSPPPVIEDDGIAEEQPKEKPEPPKEVPAAEPQQQAEKPAKKA
jgi:hypothetical protein